MDYSFDLFVLDNTFLYSNPSFIKSMEIFNKIKLWKHKQINTQKV